MDLTSLINVEDLPSHLEHSMIAQLWETDDEAQAALEELLLKSIISGNLNGTIFVRDESDATGFRKLDPDTWVRISGGFHPNGWVTGIIERSALLKWSQSQSMVIPSSGLLWKWLNSNAPNLEDKQAPSVRAVKRRDGWRDCMEHAIQRFRSTNKRLPSPAELWLDLINNPLDGFPVEVIETKNRKTYISLAGNKLVRPNFNERYKRLIKN